MSAENENTALLEKIDAYLRDELSPEEAKAFEQEINSNPGLKEEVEVNRAINFAIEHKDLKDLKDDLKKTSELIKDIRGNVQVSYELNEEISGPRKNTEQNVSTTLMERIDKFLLSIFPANPPLRLAMVAAVVLLFLIAAYIVFFQSPDPEQLYAANFTPYQNVITTSSRSDVTEQTELDKAMILYENKNYAGAIGGLNSYLHQHPDQYELKLYRGIANMQLDSINRAIEDLESVIENNRRLVDQAQWYLALVYLKDKNVSEASKILKAIAEKENTYSNQAQNILNKLN
jgi:tetratricopeptide (TPR) repeat protein